MERSARTWGMAEQGYHEEPSLDAVLKIRTFASRHFRASENPLTY
jgi:hypothetical protein